MEKIAYITVSSREEGEKIAKTLVQERLIACANLYQGVTSFYWWEGEVQTDGECSLIAKTTDSLCEEVVERVKELHSYDCPCVVFLPIAGGNEPFLSWIREETKRPDDS